MLDFVYICIFCLDDGGCLKHLHSTVDTLFILKNILDIHTYSWSCDWAFSDCAGDRRSLGSAGHPDHFGGCTLNQAPKCHQVLVRCESAI